MKYPPVTVKGTIGRGCKFFIDKERYTRSKNLLTFSFGDSDRCRSDVKSQQLFLKFKEGTQNVISKCKPFETFC